MGKQRHARALSRWERQQDRRQQKKVKERRRSGPVWACEPTAVMIDHNTGVSTPLGRVTGFNPEAGPGGEMTFNVEMQGVSNQVPAASNPSTGFRETRDRVGAASNPSSANFRAGLEGMAASLGFQTHRQQPPAGQQPPSSGLDLTWSRLPTAPINSRPRLNFAHRLLELENGTTISFETLYAQTRSMQERISSYVRNGALSLDPAERLEMQDILKELSAQDRIRRRPSAATPTRIAPVSIAQLTPNEERQRQTMEAIDERLLLAGAFGISPQALQEQPVGSSSSQATFSGYSARLYHDQVREYERERERIREQRRLEYERYQMEMRSGYVNEAAGTRIRWPDQPPPNIPAVFGASPYRTGPNQVQAQELSQMKAKVARATKLLCDSSNLLSRVVAGLEVTPDEAKALKSRIDAAIMAFMI